MGSIVANYIQNGEKFSTFRENSLWPYSLTDNNFWDLVIHLSMIAISLKCHLGRCVAVFLDPFHGHNVGLQFARHAHCPVQCLRDLQTSSPFTHVQQIVIANVRSMRRTRTDRRDRPSRHHFLETARRKERRRAQSDCPPTPDARPATCNAFVIMEHHIVR